MNKKLVIQFLKFGAVGITNTVVDLVIFNILLLLSVNHYLASVVSFFLATINSYVLNRVWTFAEKKSGQPFAQYGLFFLTSLIGFGLNLGILALFERYFISGNVTLVDNLAKIVAIGLVVIWNFIASKWLIFKD